MSIKNHGGVFGRNPSFNEVISSELTVSDSFSANGDVSISNGAVNLNGSSINGLEVIIADDAFASITPDNRFGGFLSIMANGDIAAPRLDFSALLVVDFGSTPFVGSGGLYEGGNFETNTGGPPDGTTGNDAKVTVFLGGTSGTFYLENRSGAQRSFQLTLI